MVMDEHLGVTAATTTAVVVVVIKFKLIKIQIFIAINLKQRKRAAAHCLLFYCSHILICTSAHFWSIAAAAAAQCLTSFAKKV